MFICLMFICSMFICLMFICLMFICLMFICLIFICVMAGGGAEPREPALHLHTQGLPARGGGQRPGHQRQGEGQDLGGLA